MIAALEIIAANVKLAGSTLRIMRMGVMPRRAGLNVPTPYGLREPDQSRGVERLPGELPFSVRHLCFMFSLAFTGRARTNTDQSSGYARKVSFIQ